MAAYAAMNSRSRLEHQSQGRQALAIRQRVVSRTSHDELDGSAAGIEGEVTHEAQSLLKVRPRRPSALSLTGISWRRAAPDPCQLRRSRALHPQSQGQEKAGAGLVLND